ncbi:MAG TPA: hypothetical protein VKV69_08295 [Actinomycetota bacterium]|nr:hypothetical protein [Actinomycetota bacterium]
MSRTLSEILKEAKRGHVKEHSSTTRDRGLDRARTATRWLIGGAAALSVAFPWAVWRALPGRHAATSTSSRTPVTVQLDPRLLPADHGVSAPQDTTPQVPQQQQPAVVSGGS